MRSYPIVLLLVFITGCGDLDTQTEQHPEETEVAEAVSVLETEQEIAAKSAVMPKLPAESPEQLAEAYRIAFLRGDTESISKMIYWGDQSPSERTVDFNFWGYLSRVGPGKTITVGVREVKTEFSPEIARTLTPVMALHGFVNRQDDSGSVGGQVTAPIGQIDGKFFFSIPKK